MHNIEKQPMSLAFSNEVDHSYLASENDMSSNVIYVVDPQPELHEQIESTESSSTPTTILICNPNFSNMTIMDIGAIQTVDQDVETTIP